MNPTITIEELRERMDKGEKLTIIDVREPWEYEEFNIGAINIPLATVVTMADEYGDRMNEEIIVHCKMGGRSAQAQALLQQMGFTGIRNLEGGMEAWKARYGK